MEVEYVESASQTSANALPDFVQEVLSKRRVRLVWLFI